MFEAIARRLDTEQGPIFQSLDSHLWGVASYAKQLGDQVGLGWSCLLLGVLHDTGKFSKNFVEKIINNTPEQVNHSSAGAVYLQKKLIERFSIHPKDISFEVLSYVILSHHGLFDLIPGSTGITGFKRRLDYASEENFDFERLEEYLHRQIEPKILVEFDKSLNDVIELAYAEVQNKLQAIDNLSREISKKSRENEPIQGSHYYRHLLIRLLLSILKEADIYDSSNAFATVRKPILTEDEINSTWRHGVEQIEAQYSAFAQKSDGSRINTVRTNLANQAKTQADKSFQGAIKAELPTGSGKTLLTTRFAAHHNLAKSKNRFFYITAFLSVLEQNAAEISQFFPAESVLEHHSNIVIDETKGEEYDPESHYLRQYLTDSWESPIVLTTMVQFCNTLFKGRASNILRFCKLINSTIIIDEIQSLPISTTYNLNLVTNFLIHFMGATIVHCTATQPEYDSSVLRYPVIYHPENEGNLVCVASPDKDVFKRVKAYKLTGDGSGINLATLLEHMIDRLETADSMLFIGNTKSIVRSVYERLKAEDLDGWHLFELTTDQCAAHRLEKIKRLKQMLRKGERVIICSTQLIEAGVDLDVHVVYRTMSSIASLIQAMGRCNREGKREYGLFYIVDLNDEKISSAALQAIRDAKQYTKQILQKVTEEEIDLAALKKAYYEILYCNVKQIDLKYEIKNQGAMFDLLSKNTKQRNEYFQETASEYPHFCAQAFKTSADGFELIEKGGRTAIVTLNESFGKLGEENRRLIDELELYWKKRQYEDYKKTLRKLQRFTVTLHLKDDTLSFFKVMEDVLILMPEYYNPDIGVEVERLRLLLV